MTRNPKRLNIRDEIFKEPRHALACGAVACFAIFTAIFAGTGLPLYQTALTAFALVPSIALYLAIEKGRVKGAAAGVLIALLYLAVAFIVYHPTVYNIFRSDYWYIASLFATLDGLSGEAIKKLSLFEMFGNVRFQPLAHLVMYLRHLILGTDPFPFHLLNITAHAAAAFFVYLLSARIARSHGLGFLAGLLFVVLQSQFDTVVWTYHIYIIVSTILILAAIILADNFAGSGKKSGAIVAAALSLVSILLYEPAIAVPAALVFICAAHSLCEAGPISKKQLVTVAALALCAYIAYGLVTLYGLSLTRDTPKIYDDSLLGAANVAKALKGVAINLWQTSVLGNIGIAGDMRISNIVYLASKKDLFGSAAAVGKLICALAVLLHIRITRKNLLYVAVIITLALSYLFIISLGRVQSNSITYLITQPRYQYFINAAFLSAGAVLLAKKFKEARSRGVLVFLIFSIFFWNGQNSAYLNNRVDNDMEFLDAPYYTIKGFSDDYPEAKVLVDYVPFNNGRFFLGSDIALDIMLEENLTRSRSTATHIYDGRAIRKNRELNPALAAGPLGDFEVSWMYRPIVHSEPYKDMVIAGSTENSPVISMTVDGTIFVDLKNTAGAVERYKLRHPYLFSNRMMTRLNDGWSGFAVAKEGTTLCLYLNGALYDKIPISGKGPYRQWQGPGLDLVGSHFRGQGSAAYIADLMIRSDRTILGCK